jgi:hypothetical protein
MNKKQKKVEENGNGWECKVCGVALTTETADYCSQVCEIAALKSQLAEKDEQLEKAKRRKGPPHCLGRMSWRSCDSEFYTRRSYGAKRRAHELRKLGLECDVKGAGKMWNASGEPVEVAVVHIKHKASITIPEPELIFNDTTNML